MRAVKSKSPPKGGASAGWVASCARERPRSSRLTTPLEARALAGLLRRQLFLAGLALLLLLALLGPLLRLHFLDLLAGDLLLAALPLLVVLALLGFLRRGRRRRRERRRRRRPRADGAGRRGAGPDLVAVEDHRLEGRLELGDERRAGLGELGDDAERRRHGADARDARAVLVLARGPAAEGAGRGAAGLRGQVAHEGHVRVDHDARRQADAALEVAARAHRRDVLPLAPVAAVDGRERPVAPPEGRAVPRVDEHAVVVVHELRVRHGPAPGPVEAAVLPREAADGMRAHDRHGPPRVEAEFLREEAEQLGRVERRVRKAAAARARAGAAVLAVILAVLAADVVEAEVERPRARRRARRLRRVRGDERRERPGVRPREIRERQRFERRLERGHGQLEASVLGVVHVHAAVAAADAVVEREAEELRRERFVGFDRRGDGASRRVDFARDGTFREPGFAERVTVRVDGIVVATSVLIEPLVVVAMSEGGEQDEEKVTHRREAIVIRRFAPLGHGRRRRTKTLSARR